MEKRNNRYELVFGFITLVISVTAFKTELENIKVDTGFWNSNLAVFSTYVIIGFGFSLYLYVIERACRQYPSLESKKRLLKFLDWAEITAFLIFVLVLLSPVILLLVCIVNSVVILLTGVSDNERAGLMTLINIITTTTSIFFSVLITKSYFKRLNKTKEPQIATVDSSASEKPTEEAKTMNEQSGEIAKDILVEKDKKHLFEYLFSKLTKAVETGDWNSVLSLSEDVMELKPQNSEVYFFRAKAYYGLNNIYKAVENYSKAIELDENFWKAYNNLGVIYLDDEKYDDAIKYLNKSLEKNPENDISFFNLGRLHRERKEFDQSIENFTKAISINPRFDFYVDRGNVYLSKKDFINAISDYNTAISINPEDATSYWNLYVTYKRTGNTKEARLNFEKAISLDSKRYGKKTF